MSVTLAFHIFGLNDLPLRVALSMGEEMLAVPEERQ